MVSEIFDYENPYYECIWLRRIGSRPLVGSSKRIIFGSIMSALARATLFLIPPLISDGYFSSIPERPTS